MSDIPLSDDEKDALSEPRTEPWPDSVLQALEKRATSAITRATERIAALEAENARLKTALGDDLSTCSAPGCGVWFVADNTDWHHAEQPDTATNWVWSTPPEAEYPLAWCPAHAGMAVGG